ncbi:hypothetical protein F5888DRAFT_1646677 [Russula emetica]|nr:hypothetical protein F5888DRAFT_1646677 [Russula emetica]
MSIIPPPLSPRSSTWPILRSLDTLSPSPSWTSIQVDPTACCQVGKIPLILHTGVGNVQNSINGICSDVEQDDSGSVDSFNLAYKGIPEDNTGAKSTDICSPHKSPTSKQSSLNASIKPQEKIRLMKNLPRAMPQPTAPPVVEFLQELPSNVSITPESSPDKPRHMVHKGSVHATPGTGKLTGLQGPSGHRRNGSTSTTDSGLSSRSNPPLVPHDASNILLENGGIGTVRFPLLPVSLSWLQSTTLEIMIDQEGFRMIKPVFKLAGYAPSRTKESEVVSLGAHLVSATADFMPVERKSFAFHYSELDTPPGLRRLMLNGDDSRDYLSKQAYLTLKANGPYTVQGIEHVQTSPLFLANEHSVLSWRFDYVVGDRRTEAGRIIPGEKTFTPLSFSCSPALLLPTQGKKISVMHVVKKSVAAKLTATKVEPPRSPSYLGGPGATPLSDAESEFPGAVTGKHKVSLSTALQDTPAYLHGTTEALPHLSESLQSPTRKFIEEKMDCYGH